MSCDRRGHIVFIFIVSYNSFPEVQFYSNNDYDDEEEDKDERVKKGKPEKILFVFTRSKTEGECG